MASRAIYLISDTHFSHKNILKVRPQFRSIEEMDRQLVEKWNATVAPDATVYHLGDVAMWTVDKLAPVKSLNGKKFLVRGNHDNFSEEVYRAYGFEKTLAMKEFTGVVCTHVPIHPQELYRWPLNVHGHIHNEKVQQPKLGIIEQPGEFYDAVITGSEPDPRYLCVSVEQTDYRPVSLEEIRRRHNDQQ